MKFRKKPVVIEAVKYMGPFSVDEMGEEWGESFAARSTCTTMGGLTVRTLEGNMYASIGDWIIRGVKGEFYPCKPDIFEATYEPADTLTQPHRVYVPLQALESAARTGQDVCTIYGKRPENVECVAVEVRRG